jgi:SPP1 gp7 family putative phage head morphogenesis protein
MEWEPAAEAALVKKLQKLFKDVETDVIKKLVQTGRVPAGPVAARAIAAELEKIAAPYREIMLDAALDAAQQGQNGVISELRKHGSTLAFRELSQTIAGLITDHVFEASDRTMDRVIGQVMDNLAGSYNEGLGIKETADLLRQEFENMQRYELRRIARTEINSLQNQGTMLAQQELGVQYHQWWTAEDERVRDEADVSHVQMHGQIARVGEPFSNGLLYPGDRSGGEGTIREWINCRCRHPVFIMPINKIPPIGKPWFYEHELVTVDPAA